MWWPWSAQSQKRSERAVVLNDWPQPTVVAEPQVRANDTQLSLAYRTENDEFAVIIFPLFHYVAFGAPNDEALGGHPLIHCGLKHYSVHEVVNSSLIAELEQRNSVHPKHNR
jgi:hypothetical protein